MGDIKNKNDSVIGGIIALGNKITKILDIIRTINTITGQTKVISFNAAMEAAGAGDRGKRFSVVAAKVNRLADDIAALTRQIRDHIQAIQDSSSALIISSEESADKIAEGLKLVKDLEEIFREILSGADITANQAQSITVSTQNSGIPLSRSISPLPTFPGDLTVLSNSRKWPPPPLKGLSG
ncbi:MAG: methyl-accepting chemotaxis protein [Treponema sp.]|jgi:methyl-accepting chemotaxis protein|nr:methyl-accepting chemotaxis protein [Treponema sp.]